MRRAICLLLFACLAACAQEEPQGRDPRAFPPAPPVLEERIVKYLDSAQRYQRHVWRDVAPLNNDGTANGYVEIPRGESAKWEYRIELNRSKVDRMLPRDLGGYPVNYGFLPGTISYDGDPADVLVLGPPLPGGEIVKGRILGLMRMLDNGELDPKVILSPLDASGAASVALHASDREALTRFFTTYKKHQKQETSITGWGGPADALVFLNTTAAFVAAAKQRAPAPTN